MLFQDDYDMAEIDDNLERRFYYDLADGFRVSCTVEE